MSSNKITLYDFVNDKGINEFKAWTQTLQKKQKAKLNQKLDMLTLHGEGLPDGLLSDTHINSIKKLRVQGSVQLRPLLCFGPLKISSEFTLLKGAKEIGGKWTPRNAPQAALSNRLEVIQNITKRRKIHDRVD